jgi:flavin-dependent dehydrogenase
LRNLKIIEGGVKPYSQFKEHLMDKLKIAIIGAGVAGISCALECERLGMPAEIFERHHSAGWIWPSVSVWPDIFTRRYSHDPLKYLKDSYNINIKASLDAKKYIMKSPKAEVTIEGNLGISFFRGKEVNSIENQLLRELCKTPVHYNTLANYKELSEKYDYVVVATGKDHEAKELGVWEMDERISIIGGIALGSFSHDTSTIYFNREYSGSGYARLSSFSDSQAILSLYIIDNGNFDLQQLDVNRKFQLFLEKEKLDSLELMYRLITPSFSTGKVSRFQIGNVLLAGRSAGLTDRVLGTGGIEAIISGVLAARAVILGEDYAKLLSPIKEHIENISILRKYTTNFTNEDFDKMVSVLGTHGIKQLIYNTEISIPDIAGKIISKIRK